MAFLRRITCILHFSGFAITLHILHLNTEDPLMHTPTLKQDALESLKNLPDDADIDEIIYRLYVIDKLRKSREAIKQIGRAHV